MPGTKESCPCGSGKLYENCCGERKVYYSLDQIRWRRAAHDLRRGLGEFADQPYFVWDAARAQDLYLGYMGQRLVERDDDFTMERCFEWFIFDYKLTSGRSIIETYREEHPRPLTEYEKVLVSEWARSRISLYEVTGILPGEGLEIKDLLGRRKLKVHDVNAATEIELGNILLMRVLKVGSEYEFSTSGIALAGSYKEVLITRLKRDRRDFYREKKTKDRGWGAYLKESAYKINAWVMEIGATSSSRDSAGKEATERWAILAIINWRVALDFIKKSEQFSLIRELKDAAGAFRQATAAVLGEAHLPKEEKEASLRPEKTSREKGRTFLRPVLGHMVLTPKFMLITAGSPGLLLDCKKLLIQVFDKIIVESTNHRDNFMKNTDEIFAAPTGRNNRRSGMDSFSWPEPGYAAVAGSVWEGLQDLGYNPRQQRGALKLWYDFCSKERPSIRKTAVWTAAVIYAFARLEMETGPNQQDLAGRFGVASSTISSRFKLLCKSLSLVAYDRRYTTKKPRN